LLVDAHDIEQMTMLFTRVANAAKSDPTVAEQVRDALATSGLLEVFGSAGALDVVDLLDAGGEVALRARLGQCTLAELKQIVSANNYDGHRQSTRWRSTSKFVDLIVECARQQLEHELAKQPASAASWML
jgi:hypothetical protein